MKALTLAILTFLATFLVSYLTYKVYRTNKKSSNTPSLSKAIDIRETSNRLIPPCDLSRYQAIMETLPHPSHQQIENFIQFVCQAHSWYKIFGQRIPFYFFIDPYSGCDRFLLSDGRVLHEERTEKSKKSHYLHNWIKTDEYHLRFGYLNYTTNTIGVFANEGKEYQIPEEVAKAGLASVTAFLHPRLATLWFWKILLSPTTEERNANSKLEIAKTICQQLVDKNKQLEIETEKKMTGLSEPEKKLLKMDMHKILYESEYEVNDELWQLFSEERQWCYQEMKNAIQRMTNVVYG